MAKWIEPSDMDGNLLCPSCGKPMRLRKNGKTGAEFFGCSGFPACRQTFSVARAVQAYKAQQQKPENDNFKATPQQAAIIKLALTLASFVVRALAGTGKTTTIIQIGKALLAAKGKVTIFASCFSKDVAVELQDRCPVGMTAGTAHSWGFSAIRKADKGATVLKNDKKSKAIAERLLAGDDKLTKAIRKHACKMTGLAKNYVAESKADLDAIISKHAIAFDAPEGHEDEDLYERVIALTLRILAESKYTSEVDYNDMLWLPIVMNLPGTRYDVVMIDEAQDLNAAQLDCAERMVKNGGQVIAVGDENQAIFGFRGSMSDSLDQVRERFGMTEHPLSVCFRCCKAVIRLAQRYVPEIQALDNADEGEVHMNVSRDSMLTMVKPGDMMLARKNATNVSTCLKLWTKGVPAIIKGKDLAKTIKAVIKDRLKRNEQAESVEVAEVVERLQAWATKRIAKLLDMDAEGQADEVRDQVAAIRAVATHEGVDTAADLLAALDKLFGDNGDLGDKVVLSSVHKAKGLEADRVFILAADDMPLKYARDGWEMDQEYNLIYVAITRAMKALYIEGTLG